MCIYCTFVGKWEKKMQQSEKLKKNGKDCLFNVTAHFSVKCKKKYYFISIANFIVFLAYTTIISDKIAQIKVLTKCLHPCNTLLWYLSGREATDWLTTFSPHRKKMYSTHGQQPVAHLWPIISFLCWCFIFFFRKISFRHEYYFICKLNGMARENKNNKTDLKDVYFYCYYCIICCAFDSSPCDDLFIYSSRLDWFFIEIYQNKEKYRIFFRWYLI